MHFWSIINIILNVITLINSIATILICLFTFLLVIIVHRQTRTVLILLACHTCLILMISAILLGSMTTSSIIGFMDIKLKQHANTNWCRWRGYLIHGFLCILYDSYVLQAAFRFFRVVFSRHKILHNFPVYCFVILIASLFGLISISPVIIRNDVIYLPSEYYCQTPFTNIPVIVYIAVRLFLIPIVFIAIIYLCLLRHIGGQANLLRCRHRRRSRHNGRNLKVIRRLLLMLTTLIFLGLPSMIFLTILILAGHLVSLTYRIGWLSVSFSLVFLAYMLIQLTRPLRKTMRRFFRRETS
ncbi:unnamed protein product [Rotaria magnacalcarata]|uniref:G-protein coupled receptors family 1 profile domain-containing protein n=2 Tax=Rotaria magnacalcarata TaxID=392030 RepID=A0A815RU57_9BILA|nr:unnamed protein product [Rotaria magnacalcarata]